MTISFRIIDLLILLEVLELVGGSDDLPGGGVVVVAEVIGDDSAGAHKVIVLVEEDAGPGELPRGGLAMREAINRASIGPGAASLSSIDRGLVTSLGPGLSILTSLMMLIQLLGGGIGADALVIALKWDTIIKLVRQIMVTYLPERQ